MKKLIALVLVALFLIPMIAFADVDLSRMSLEDLISLDNQVINAIQNFNVGDKGTRENPYVVGDSVETTNYENASLTIKFIEYIPAEEVTYDLREKAAYTWQIGEAKVDIAKFMVRLNRHGTWSDDLSVYCSQFSAYDSEFISVEHDYARGLGDIAEGTAGYQYVVLLESDNVRYLVYDNRVWFKLY